MKPAQQKRAQPPEQKPEQPPELFTKYRVRWIFLTNVCASVPADPDIIRDWLKAREPRVKPAGALSIEEINEEVLASIERGEGEADQDYQLLVFQKQDGHIVQRAGTVRAHYKDCARVLSAQFISKITGTRAFSTRVINGVYPDKRTPWIPITRVDGTLIREPDGERDKAIHVRGPRGEPLNALKRYAYIAPPSMMEFTLNVLGRSISPTDLDHLFMYGGEHGYGGERGDGEGKYDYEIIRLGSERPENSDVRGTYAAV